MGWYRSIYIYALITKLNLHSEYCYSGYNSNTLLSELHHGFAEKMEVQYENIRQSQIIGPKALSVY